MLAKPRSQSFDWGEMEWLAEGADKDVTLASMTVKPFAVSPMHKHSNCNEVIHLLSGAVAQRRGEHWVEMQSGDTVIIYADELHQTRNIGETDALLMIAYSSGERSYEEAEA